MTDKKNDTSGNKADKNNKKKPNKPTLGGETVEARILLSATWITGTTGDDTVNGTDGHDSIAGLAGDDILSGGGGDDLLVGGEGDDTIDGGTGTDTVSYADASGAVTVDLTITTAQDTGQGTDKLVGIEAVTGSNYDDTFVFSDPANGASYTVNGGAGTNTVDLSTFSSSQAKQADGTITVADSDRGVSFTISFENITSFTFSDMSVRVPGIGSHTAPTADAGVDQTVDEGDLVTLTAAGTTAGDSDSITYSWVQTSGPTVTLSDPCAAQPTFTAPEGLGNFDVTFDVTASDGKLATVDSVTININADNDAPTADAGVDQAVDGNTLVTLDATGSSDPEGEGLSYTWTQTSGPTVTLSDASAAQPTFTTPNSVDVETIEFQVQVSDGTNVTVDTVTVTAKPPSLLGQWTFDGTGQIVQDVSGGGNDGNLGWYSSVDSTDPTRVDDPDRGDVLHFNGSQLVDDIGQGPTGSFTLSAWVNQSAIATGFDTIYSSEGWETGLSVNADTGQVVMSVGGSGNRIESAAGIISSNTWQHVTGTWDGVQGRIYVDGVEVSVSVVGAPSDPVAANAAIGAQENSSSANYLWQGKLDDVRAYDEALSASEVLALTGNTTPTADAGVDQTVDEGDVVTLNATSSSDAEGSSLTYSWTQVSGPSVTLSDATAAQPTFTAPEGLTNTTVQFQLTVSDGFLTSSVDTVSITVNADNDAPTAEAGTNQTVNEGDAVTLNGTASTDPEGQSLTYSWTQVSGPSVTLSDATAAQPTFTAPEGLTNSTIQFQLTVSDGTNTSSVDTVSITVNADNDAPTAEAGTNQSVDEGDAVTLNGTASTDPEGQSLTYSWTQVSGPSVTLSDATAAQPTFTAPEGLTNSTVQFQLTVSDGTNTSSVDTVSITVNADNDAPTAEAGTNQTVDNGDTVTLDGTGSSDPEGQTLTYSWVQLSGPPATLDDATAAQPCFTASEGTYQFQLTVSDGTNTSSVDTVTVSASTPAAAADAPAAKAMAPAPNVAPVSDAGIDQVVDEGDVVTLDGLTSSDADGDALTYSWVQVSGPTVTLSDATAAQPTFTAPDGLSNSTVQFQLTVSDGDATSNIDTVSITINADNDAPTAEAGSDQTVDEGDAVTLNGTASTDPEGQSLTYSWTQVSGPSVTLSDATAAQPTFTAPEGLTNSTMQFQLTVSDGTNTSSVDTVSITVNADNDAPTAEAGVNQTVDEGDAVTLNGLASTDSEGQSLTYSWTQVSGPSVTLSDATAAQPTFTAPEGLSNSTIQFQLTVSDGTNTSSVDTVTITVNADNDAPTAEAGVNQTVDEGDAVTLNGTASTDPEGQSLTYSWTQVSGPSVTLSDATAAQPTFTAPEGITNSTVQFQLTVSDGTNTSSVDTVSITVNADNDAPTAEAGVNQTVDEGDTVTLNGTASTDPEGQSLTYSWTQVSGPSVTLSDATAAQPTFTAPEGLSNSTVQFQLTVSDGTNTSSVDTVSITVNADNDAPTAEAGTNRTVDEGDAVTLNGTASTDPEGQSLTYSWTQVSGPSVTLSDATAAQPTFTAPEGLTNSTVQFQLTVSDGTNTSSVDTVSITVNADNDAPTAEAGADLDVNEGDTVTLNGTASTDPEGQSLTYSWTQVSGPSVTLSDATAAQPKFAAPEGLSNSTIQFQLTVSDGTNTSSVDTVTITVNADNDAPTAEAGTNQTVDEGDAVTLNGLASTDPEGQSLTYSWTQVSGPSVTLSDATAAQPTFTAPEGLTNSTVQFQLTVSDGTNTSSVDTVAITVNADNDAPAANAGPNRAAQEGDVVTLNGSGTTDPEGETITYTWAQTRGPTVVLSDVNAVNPTFTAPEGLTNTFVEFQLTASDGTSASADTVRIFIAADNDAPTADAGSPQAVAEGGKVVLDGSGSSDPEGQGLTYNWVQTSGPEVRLDDPTAAQPTFTAPDLLTNTKIEFELIVSDGSNSSSASSVSVIVNADNDAPTADAGSNQITKEGDVVTLNGGGSSDPEGVGLTYSWTQVSGPTVELSDANAEQPQFEVPELVSNSIVRFELTVSDGTNTSTDIVTIGIGADDDAPSVDAGRPQVVMHNQQVQLGATATDPEGQDLTYQWRQLSGPQVNLDGADGAAPSFTSPYAPDGATMRFAVAVSDGTTTTYDTVAIVVAPNSGPSVQIDGVQDANSGEMISLMAGAVDSEGDPLTYSWTQVSGPSVMLSSSDEPQLQFQAPNVTGDAEITFQVEVSDGHRTTISTVSITVTGTEPVTQPRVASTPTAEEPVTPTTSEEVADAPVEPQVSTPMFDSTEAQEAAAAAASTTDSDAEQTTVQTSLQSTAQPVTLGEMTAVTLGTAGVTLDDSMSDAESNTTSDSTAASMLTDETSMDTVLGSNLLDESLAAADSAAAITTNIMRPDFMVADSGTAVELRAPTSSMEVAEEAAEVRWKQVSGTPVEVVDDSGEVLTITFPEVFSQEEIVFEVEVMSGGQKVVQEVTVQVQPVNMTSRSLSIDEHIEHGRQGTEIDDDQGSRGFGKIWGALLAFFGAQAGRKKER